MPKRSSNNSTLSSSNKDVHSASMKFPTSTHHCHEQQQQQQGNNFPTGTAEQIPVVQRQVSSMRIDTECDAASQDGTFERKTTFARRSERNFDAASGKSGATTTTSDSEDSGMERAVGDSLLAKCLKTIPFTILVVLLLLIPIGFLVIYSILSFVEHAGTLTYVRRHADLMNLIAHCEEAIRFERTSTTFAMVDNDTHHFGELLEARSEVDEHCIELARKTKDASDEELRSDFSGLLTISREKLVVVRHEAESGDVTPSEARKVYNEFISVLNHGTSIFGTADRMVGQFSIIVELQLLQEASNQLTICNAVGGEILLRSGQVLDHGISGELYACHEQLTSTIERLRSMAHHEGIAFLHFYDTEPIVQFVISMIDTLAEDPDAGLIGMEEWETTFHEVNEEFEEHASEDPFLDAVKKDSTRAVLIEVAKLVPALIGCLIAMTLIIRANMLTQTRIDTTLVKSKRMQAAVQKFVPRAFLKLCGCTSILHVCAGDQTQVAVSMLYSNLRNFALVSSRMNNEQLFDWLQSYLKRMTNITEAAQGFVEKFLGDAVVAVFTAARNAVRCGIQMHTAVGQLNLDFMSNRVVDMIDIGVGVHHGVVCAGFLGDESRLSVTLISPEVTMASRLESISKKYGARVLVSQAAADQISDIETFEHRSLGEVTFRGTEKPIGIVDIFQADDLAMKRYKTESRSTFEEAVKLRTQGNIPRSNMLFERCRTMASAVDLEDSAVSIKLLQSDPRDTIDG